MRMSVACTAEPSSSARVSAARSSPAMRDHRPTYIDGAYWAWMPPTRSSTRGSGSAWRSSRPWRASSARLSSRWDSSRIRRDSADRPSRCQIAFALIDSLFCDRSQ